MPKCPPAAAPPELARPDWWAKAHPQRAAAEAALAREAAAVAASRRHEAHGTPETLLKAARTRQGAIARLYEGGHLSLDQFAWAGEIRAIAERIGRDVAPRSISLETRIDNAFAGHLMAEESLRQVRAEMAYSGWRGELARPGPVLAIIVEDRGCRMVARAFRMRDSRARALLIVALDAWPDWCGWARDAVSAEDLAAAHRRLA